jgi:2-polyprenyl-3-methyl-5-hydroxy-6-metoxy-1,4-benzoquinol methylase
MPYLEKPDVRLVRCEGCSMLLANPVPAEFGQGTFYDARGESFYLSPAKLTADYAEVRFERELRLFRRFCAAGAVLDVGCSTGAFLFQLKRSAPDRYAVSGLEVSRAAAEHARGRGLEVSTEPFLGMDVGRRRFQAVTFWAVLEHVAEPRRFLEQAAALLTPGGHVFVLVPNMGSLAARLLGARYRYILPEHLNYFTARTLRALVARVPGLEIVETGTLHFNPLVIWQDLRRRAAPVTDAERASLLGRTTRYKQNPWFGPLKLAYRAVEKGLAALDLADNLYAVLRSSAGHPSRP